MRGVLAAVIIASAGCAAPLPENYVDLPTADWNMGTGRRVECGLMGFEGTLVEHESRGIALNPSNEPIAVVWPLGWYGLREDDHILLVDESGNTVARTGDHVSIIGRDVNDAFMACPYPGGITRR